MSSPHKHADVISAWVNGAIVRARSPSTDEWIIAPPSNMLWHENKYLEPSPIHPEYDYYGWEVFQE